MNTLEDLYYGNLFPQEKCARLYDEVKEPIKTAQQKRRETYINSF